MNKEMEKVTERKQAPRRVARRVAAALMGVTEVVAPLIALAEESRPKTEVSAGYEVVYNTEDIFNLSGWQADAFDVLDGKDHETDLINFTSPLLIKGDFEVKVGIKWPDPSAKSIAEIVLFPNNPSGEGGAKQKIHMFFGQKGQWSIDYVRAEKDKNIIEWEKPPASNNFIIRFENVGKNKGETVSIFDGNTHKLLAKIIQLPEPIFSSGKLYLAFDLVESYDQQEALGRVMDTISFQVSAPKGSGNVTLEKPSS